MKINCRACCYNIFASALIFSAGLSASAAIGQASPKTTATTSPQETINQTDNPANNNNQKTTNQTDNKDEQQKKEEQKKEEQRKKEATAQNQLKLGEAYEAEGLFKEAEAAYVKAMESEVEQTQIKAFEGVKRVIQERESRWRKYLWSPLETIATTILPAILPLALFAVFYFLLKSPAEKLGEWYGKNKLTIESFTDTTQHKLGGNMVKVLEVMLKLMDEHYKPRSLITKGVKMPYLLKSQDSEFTTLATSFAPAGLGKVISWLSGKLSQPEFAVQGTIQTSGTNLDVFVILVRREEILRTWSRQMPAGGTPVLLDQQKDLAYEVLMYLKEYLEDEHAS